MLSKAKEQKKLRLALIYLYFNRIYKYVIETLDKNNGNAFDAWQQMGSPHSPTREQTAILKDKGWNTMMEVVRADSRGCLVINRSLQPWTCMLITQQQ